MRITKPQPPMWSSESLKQIHKSSKLSTIRKPAQESQMRRTAPSSQRSHLESQTSIQPGSHSPPMNPNRHNNYNPSQNEICEYNHQDLNWNGLRLQIPPKFSRKRGFRHMCSARMSTPRVMARKILADWR
uniref:Uncharacterized protein n=1 Tax=Physcomitrium patens TaxID=3218 RepID=A0A2K1JXC3_PHYPA|nr:hypothetical protein PHYPA_013280 [Physcomitrium patens]